MKLFLTTTLALSTICIIDANQAAQATLGNDSHFHLARGEHIGHGGEMREIRRPDAQQGIGEGPREDASSQPHTEEAPEHVHTAPGEGAGKDVSSEPETKTPATTTDGGRLHELRNGDDLGAGCPEGQIVGINGACADDPDAATVNPTSPGWTTVPD